MVCCAAYIFDIVLCAADAFLVSVLVSRAFVRPEICVCFLYVHVIRCLTWVSEHNRVREIIVAIFFFYQVQLSNFDSLLG